MKKYLLFAFCLVLGIGMLNAQNSGMEKTVTVETPGQLASLLTASEKDDITSLTVSGNLNDDDLRLLRYMAGRDEYGNITPGSLANLDMLNANIVSGGNKGYYVNENGDWYWSGENGFNYRLFKDCHSIQSIILPSSVKWLSSEVFSGCTRLESVRLPEGLERIEWGAFYNCSKLNDINLPSSLRNIATNVFYNCRNLKSIDLSNIVNISMIPGWTFQSSGLTTITIPSNILTIGEGAFDNSKLTNVVFAENSRLKTLGNNSFSNCFDLKTIVIPDSVTSIGNYCFGGSRSLSTVSLSDNSNLVSIGNNAFEGCPLQSFTVPKRVKIMGAQNFSEYLTSLSVAPGNNAIIYSQGIMYCTDGTLIYIDHNSKILNIPESIMMSLNGATRYNGNLETVIIPSSVEDWGDSPFDGDYNLKELYCLSNNPPTVRYLTGGTSGQFTVYVPFGSKATYMALDEWKYLNIVELPAQPEIRLSESALSLGNVKGMKATASLSAEIVTPTGFAEAEVTWSSSDPNVANISSEGVVTILDKSGTTTISATAVVGNETITAHCNVKVSIFDDSDNLYYLTAENSLRSLIGDDNKYNVEKLVLMGQLSDDDRNFIREMACNHWEGNQEVVGSLKHIDMSELSDTVIWSGAFSNCGSLETVILPMNVKKLDNSAFAACTNITSLNIPDGVKEIGPDVFSGCSNLIDINIPSNIKTIESNLFQGCTSLESIIVPESVTIIKNSAFSGCSNLKQINLPQNLVSIEQYAFYGCSELNSIIIPKSVSVIGAMSFYGCIGVKSLKFEGNTAPQITEDVFGGIQSNCCIVVPANASGYETDDYWKDLQNVYRVDELPLLVMDKNTVELYTVQEGGANSEQLYAYAITADGIVTTGINWNSSNEAVVHISENGLISSVGIGGNSIITATYVVNNTEVSSECIVNVIDASGYRFVNVAKAGELSKLLSEDEIYDTKKLIVTGELNNDDIRVLRYMAGRDEYGNLTVGSLEVLDMGKARIVSGGKDGYYYRDNWWRGVSENCFGSEIFRECNSLKKVILPTSLYNLESYAFSGCQNLEEVVLPEGLTNVGYDSFRECHKLSKINIPSSVTNISSGAFYGCQSLKSIDLSTMTGVSTIPYDMFGNTGLTSIVIPANITNIGERAYQGTPLKTVVFEAGSRLATISECAFQSTQLQSITIPASVTNINNYAFSDCRSLSVVNYEDNNKLTSLGENVFNGCPIQTFLIPKRLIYMGHQDFSESLSQIVVEEGNKYFEMSDGVLYSKAENALVYAPKNQTSIYLPDYVTSIKNGALRSHYNLTTLVLTSTITDLGESPFCENSNLKEIYCMNPEPPVVQNLTNGWYGTVYIPTGSKKDYEDAKWDSNILEERSYTNSVVLSDSNLTLYDANGGRKAELVGQVFSNNGPVQYSTVTWTSSDASVVSVNSNGQISYVGPGIATITASTKLDGNVYSSVCNVTSISVSDPDNTYYLTGNGDLRSLIGEENKYNIGKLVLIGKLSVDDAAFIREISSNRWEDNQEMVGSLKNLDMSELVDTIIWEGAFENCRSLETVILPRNVKKLNSNVFAYCSNLRHLTIPASVTELGWGALRACNGLKSVQFTGMTVPLIDNTFVDISSNYIVVVPSGSSGYMTNDYWKDMTNIYESDMLPMIFISSNSISLYNVNELGGNTEQLSAYAITSEGPITVGLNWGSSNNAIVTVTEDGLIKTGGTEGQAIVTASYTESGKTVTAECQVSVKDISDFRFVNVATAGSLSSLLTENEILDTKKLIVAGELNNDDIRVLRYMAGRDEYGNLTVGSLEVLDMGKARIVSGGKDGYYYRDNWWRGVVDNYFGSDIFRECNSLKKVILPTSLYNLESYAFTGCQNLEEVVLPDGLANVGYEIFSNCRKLSIVNLPSSVTNISGGAFYGCQSLKSIDLSTMTGVSTIPYDMFGNTGLTSIVIPANITNIGERAFQGTPLKTVVFEAGSRLATISEGAFQSTQLQSVTIPASVTSINNYAFDNCQKLSEVIYEENNKLTSFGDNVFNGCPIQTFIIPKRLISMGRQDFSESLTQIVVEDGNKFFESVDGVLCSKAENALLFVPKRKKSLYLPDYVTTLKNGVLQYHYDLQMLVLSANMSDLGDSPFYQCNNLKEIYCLNPVSPTARNLVNDFPYATVYIAEGSRNTYIEAGWDDPRITLVEHSFSNSLSLTSSEQIIYNVEGGNHVKLEAKVFSTSGPLPNASIDWISSDPSVVTVNSEGMLSYAGEGTATITASITLDGTLYSDNCLVNTKKIENTENVTFIFVETAGNLHNQISAEDKKTITDLVVFGNINGDDIRFIREMAMIPYASWEQTPEGSLEYLDLSGATIVEGGSDYGYAEWVDENGGGHGEWPHTEANVIGKTMFRNSPILNTVILPNNVTIIDLYAFRDCPRLENVVLPKSLSFIDYDAFANCPLLSSFVIPESIDSLGMNALRGFDEVYTTSNTPIKLLGAGLISEDALIIVPASALQVYRSADNWKQFAGQIMPDNLNIQSVAVLEVTAEEEGSGLLTAAGGDDALAFITDLTLKGTINGRDIAMIRNRMPRLHNLDLSDVNIVANPHDYYTDSHSENNRLGRNAFRELKNLRRVVLPKTINYIGEYAFYQCNNLISVKIYNGVNTIDYEAFAECYNLVDVEMSEGLLSIGNGAFRNCSMLEEINIPSTVLSMGMATFQSCYRLKSIILPRNMTRIEGETFWYCSSLESVILPTKINRIEYNAFYGCSKLKELRLPPMIESIGDRAFYDCGNIKDVYVYIANSKDVRIDENTFSCWTSATLHIPNFSYYSYFWDTRWGKFYSKVEFSDTYDEFYTKNTLALNEETGTIQGDPDAVLYEQGGLVVTDIEQELNNVELISDATTDETNGASIISGNNGNIKANKLTIRIKVAQHRWHFFCFPFDIQLDSIQYDGEYVWRQYDGYKRSRHDGGWQDLDENDKKLHKGRGYIFQGTVDGELVMTVNAPDLSAKDETTTLFSYESDYPSDASWNFVGNPYTSYYNIDDAAYDAPITVWTGNGYEAYRPGDDDYAFYPYQAFFVQAPADGSSINFSTDGRDTYDGAMQKVAAGVARRASARVNPDRMLVNLNIKALGDSTYTDKTRVVFNNNHTMDYELGCDAAKFFSENRSIEIYTLDNEGTKYSINERPVADGTVMMSISVNKTGMYGISASRMDTPITIEDKLTGDMFDLSQGEYVFSAKQGESNRFVLHATGGIVSSVKNIGNNKNDRKNDIFNLSGTRISETDANGIIIINNEKVLVK